MEKRVMSKDIKMMMMTMMMIHVISSCKPLMHASPVIFQELKKLQAEKYETSKDMMMM